MGTMILCGSAGMDLHGTPLVYGGRSAASNGFPSSVCDVWFVSRAPRKPVAHNDSALHERNLSKFADGLTWAVSDKSFDGRILSEVASGEAAASGLKMALTHSPTHRGLARGDSPAALATTLTGKQRASGGGQPAGAKSSVAVRSSP